MAGPFGDVGVNLTVSASTKGIEQVNRQVLALAKNVTGLAGKATGPQGLRGGALQGWMKGLGFSEENLKKIKSFQNDLNIAMRPGPNAALTSAMVPKIYAKHAEAVALLGAESQKTARSLELTGRQSYYVGMMVTRLGYAFVAASAALTAYGVASFRVYADFQSSMKDVEAQGRLTAEQTDEIGKTFRQLSKETMFSAVELSKAGVTLARTGIILTHGMEGYNNTMMAAVSLTTIFARSGLTLDTSLESIVKTLNQFNLSATETGRVVAGLATTTALTIADVNDLTQALAQAGPIANQTNISLEKTLAILGVLANAGIKAGNAGRHFRIAMTMLERHQKRATKPMRELLNELEGQGISLSELNIKTRGVTYVLEQLRKANLGVAETTDMFRMRAASSVLVLMQQTGLIDELASKIGDVKEFTDMFGTASERLDVRLKILRNNVQAFSISLGEVLAPHISKIIDKLTDMFRKMDDMSPAVKRLVVLFGALAAALLFVMGVALIMKGFMISATISWGVLSGAIGGAVSAAITIIPWILGIAAVLAILVIIVASVRVAWKELDDSIKNVIKTLPKLALRFTPIIGGLLTMGTAIWNNRKAILEWAEGIAKATMLLKDLPWMLAKAEFQYWKFGKAMGETTWSLLGKEIEKRWGKGLFETAFIPDTTFVDKVKKEMADMAKEIFGAFAIPIGLMDKFMADILSKFITGTEKIKGTAIDFAKEEAERLAGILDKMVGATDDVISDMSTKWSDHIFNLVKGTKTFSEVWQDVMDDALRNFIGGFVRGMLEAHSQMLGKMVAQWWTAQTTMGFGAGSGGWWSAISGVLGLFGGAAGGAASFAGEAFNLGSSPLHPGNIPMFAEGAIVRRPTLGMIGESGPEAIVPLDEYRGGDSLTIINVVDPNFVNAQIANEPNTVINVINADLIKGGSTRRTLKRVR